jgi:hypothetical protein
LCGSSPCKGTLISRGRDADLHSNKLIKVVATLVDVDIPSDKLRRSETAAASNLATGVARPNCIDIAGAWHTKGLARSRKICTAALEVVEIQ